MNVFRLKYDKTCIQCGTAFVGKKINAKFCSRKCMYQRNGRLKTFNKKKHKYIWNLKAYYKWTPADYDSVMQVQNNRCANPGCNVEFNTGPGTQPRVDHDHSCCPGKKTCGKCVRGILCDACNFGLGKFRDSVEKLEGAISYLEIYKNLLTNEEKHETLEKSKA